MSVRVNITLDTERLLADASGSTLVDTIADYPKACAAVRAALSGGSAVKIKVHHKPAATWLTAYAQGDGDPRILVRRYTARDALSERWHITVPTTVTDNDIVLAGLLDVEVSSREGQQFNDLLLETFYNPYFVYGVFPAAQLGLLLNEFDSDRWKAASRRPIVAKTYKDRLNNWFSRAQSDAIRSVIDLLRDDPTALRRDICSYSLLQNYDANVGKKVLGDRWEIYRRAKLGTEGIDLSHADPSTAISIEYHLTSIKSDISNPSDLLILLGQMSGHLDCEFEFIESHLRSHTDWISADLLREIEHRFYRISSRVAPRLAKLRRLIQPSFPPAPDPAWSGSQWLSWVQKSYMPYYAWLEEQSKIDETLSEYSETFGRWFYDHFITLKSADQELFSYSALYRERGRMTAPDAVALALVVDNFNFVHFEEMRRTFARHDLVLAAVEPVLSLVPTATEVGKAALIATTGDPCDVTGNNYGQLVEKGWSQPVSGRRAEYLPNIGALQQLSARKADIYFLNFLPIDEALHDDAQETGRPHSEVIFEHLTTLAKSVADFAKRFGLEKHLIVYAISDHGATKISKGVVNVLDPAFYKGIADKKHHRFLALSDDQFKNLPQMAESQCFLMDRETFKTAKNYLAARGYYRFQPTSEGFYVHGGLTPEEVVVPFARFTMVAVTPDVPTLVLLPADYRYSVRTALRLEVGNPNSFPLERVRVRIVDSETDGSLIELLGAKEQQTVELITTFKKTVGGSNERTVAVHVSYTYQETEYTAPEKSFLVTVKPVVEEKDDFSDIF